MLKEWPKWKSERDVKEWLKDSKRRERGNERERKMKKRKREREKKWREREYQAGWRWEGRKSLRFLCYLSKRWLRDQLIQRPRHTHTHTHTERERERERKRNRAQSVSVRMKIRECIWLKEWVSVCEREWQTMDTMSIVKMNMTYFVNWNLFEREKSEKKWEM